MILKSSSSFLCHHIHKNKQLNHLLVSYASDSHIKYELTCIYVKKLYEVSWWKKITIWLTRKTHKNEKVTSCRLFSTIYNVFFIRTNTQNKNEWFLILSFVVKQHCFLLLFVIHELLHPQYSLKLKFCFWKHTSVKSDIGSMPQLYRIHILKEGSNRIYLLFMTMNQRNKFKWRCRPVLSHKTMSVYFEDLCLIMLGIKTLSKYQQTCEYIIVL